MMRLCLNREKVDGVDGGARSRVRAVGWGGGAGESWARKRRHHSKSGGLLEDKLLLELE